MKDPKEFIIDELTRKFHDLLKASSDGEKVIVDFTELPEQFVFAIPQPVCRVSVEDPIQINALDIIEKTLPGLYGYAQHSRLGDVKICSCCGKVHKK